jgi:3-octaprenyl-4-hydroxybenzoate carboxy-lyase Rift-related domain/3-octaprenyl-4-hydroxybenzoate carboxy-lyase N-terminal domain
MTDLREFLKGTEKLGELKTVRNADWNLEVGAITEISGAEPNPPALLFEDIKDYPPGFRILTNMFQTQSRTALALGLPTTLRGVDLVRAVKDILKSVAPLPPVLRDNGPIQENFFAGKDANVLRFPAPKLHREDGGRYLGTADAVITKDPDAGWVNLGTARVQVIDEQRVSLYVSPGKQTRLIAQKYWEQGRACPVALVCGIDPVLFAVAGVGLPWGMSEYDFAGHIQKSPVEVIHGEMTGLRRRNPATRSRIGNGRAIRRVDRLLRLGNAPVAADSNQIGLPSQRSDSHRAAGFQELSVVELFVFGFLRGGLMERNRASRHHRHQRRVARRMGHALLSGGLAQTTLRRPRPASGAHRSRRARGRLSRPFRRARGRRYRSREHGRRHVGRVHPLRSKDRHRDRE